MAPRRDSGECVVDGPQDPLERTVVAPLSPSERKILIDSSLSIASPKQCSGDGLSIDSPSSLTGGKDLAPPTILELSESYEDLCNRAKRLSGEVEEEFLLTASPVVRACKQALKATFATMEEEVALILATLRREDRADVASDIHLIDTPSFRSLRTTPWHASLAMGRAESYLGAIEQAFHTIQFRSNLDDQLSNALASLSQGNLENDDPNCAFLSISRWTLPRLAFDVTIGAGHSQALGDISIHDRAPKKAKLPRLSTWVSRGACSLPLQVQVRAIAEIFASELQEAGSSGARVETACQVSVESCVHSNCSSSDIFGCHFAVGQAVLVVRICPTDPEAPLRVKEARICQVNAVPPRPQANADLYTSTAHDSNEVSVFLRCPTQKSLQNAAPQLLVDLVIGSN